MKGAQRESLFFGEEDVRYLRIVNQMVATCEKSGVDIRLLGGTITDFLSPRTEIAIDITQRTVSLKGFNPPQMQRKDGTYKDIDGLCFTEDRDAFLEARREFKSWEEEAKKLGISFPQISIEATRYPHWPERRKLRQFVTVFEVDENQTLNLTYGKIKQPISLKSVDPWTLKLLEIDPETGSNTTILEIPTLSPIAHALCYCLRVPSGVKRKDKQIVQEEAHRYSKMSLLMKFARLAKETGLQDEDDYFQKTYKDWIDYIQALKANSDAPFKESSDKLTWVKTRLTKFYWENFGETAHGKGQFGFLYRLNDKMSSVK